MGLGSLALSGAIALVGISFVKSNLPPIGAAPASPPVVMASAPAPVAAPAEVPAAVSSETAPSAKAPTDFTVDRATADLIPDIVSWLSWTQGRVVPETMTSRRRREIRLMGVREPTPSTINVATLGLAAGDRLVSINGIDLAVEGEETTRAVDALRGVAGPLTLRIDRGGQTTDLVYRVH
jgi:hypothetical protein